MKKILAILVGVFFPLNILAAALPQVLTDVDASLYEQIFMLQDKEKINTAIKVQNQIADKLLMNEVLYQRYISDSYRTRGREIVEWMELYYDSTQDEPQSRKVVLSATARRTSFVFD